MPLSAYLPLEQVYTFHESAETWIWRRYAPTVEQAAGAERTRGQPFENPIALFRDRSGKSSTQTDAGQRGPATCIVYTRTKLLTTQDADPQVQPADVLFNPADLSAWQATASGDWDEALGYAVTLTRAGSRGMPPWV